MLYRAPVDTSPATEGITLFKYQLLLLLLLLLLLSLLLLLLVLVLVLFKKKKGARKENLFFDISG